MHAASGKRAGFGLLAEAAAKLKVPTDVPLKPRASFHLVGTRVPRLDAPAKARGQIAFGIDTQLPGMLVAVVVRPPSFAGKLAHFDAAKAQGMPGVRRVIPIDSGIAVVADGYWHARLAAREVKVEWNTPDPILERVDSRQVRRAREEARGGGREEGGLRRSVREGDEEDRRDSTRSPSRLTPRWSR